LPNIEINKGIGVIASAFGCKYLVNDKSDPWLRPIINEKNINDVYKLKMPNAITNPIFNEVYKRINFLQANSELPLRLAKIPSPLVTASMIWDYSSFIEATIIHPKKVHILLEKITEVTINFVQEQIRRIRSLFSMTHEMWYIPRNLGIRISDDVAAILSPTLYKQFGVKYNSIISKAFGGIVIHSCGDIQNVVQTMMEVENLKGLDFTLPNNKNWEIIKKTILDKVAINFRYRLSDIGINSNIELIDYTKQIIEFFGRKGVFLQTSSLSYKNAQIFGEKLHNILSQKVL